MNLSHCNFSPSARYRAFTIARCCGLLLGMVMIPLLNAQQNLAPTGTAILGVKESLTSGPETETPFANSGSPANVNDGDLNTRVDTYNGGGLQTVSYVGVTWDAPVSAAVAHLDLTFALFGNGGWFGVNGTGPSAGGLKDEHLVEPRVEIMTDGVNWTNVPASSDYHLALRDQAIGAPNKAKARFTLAQPAQNILGIRIIGTEGGTVSGGFLGVFELMIFSPGADSDNDGMEDEWETRFGLNVGQNDAAADADGDGLSNLEEYRRQTDPKKADTDGDTLSDGAEVLTHKTNPLRLDTDGDTLNDGAELATYHSNPLLIDSDGDGFADGTEVSSGSDPANSANYPQNLAILGQAILGGKDALESGPEGELIYANSGSAANINDGKVSTRVDTYGRGYPVSFVGIVWPTAVSKPISLLDLTFALFSNGGWFGVNGVDPGAGGALTLAHLTEPQVEVTTDGGASWNVVPHTSNYISTMTGQGIGGGANPNPNPVTVTFTLKQPAVNINGIRLVGTDGGAAGGGFLGVFELATRSIPADSDNDGMDDAWERTNGLNVGVNDAAGDLDNDGLFNLEEFKNQTNPKVADSDDDGLNDGAEVKTHQTNPLRADTDGDGLSDGDEVNRKTNPLVKDTDNDGFSDYYEVAEGSDPTSAASVPNNIAALGTGILGKKDSLDSGIENEVPVFNSGNAGSINDGNLNTRVDTYGRNAEVSFVGIVWDAPITNAISKVKLTHALFSNGGWFGAPGIDPGPGGLLAVEHVTEPRVEVTTDGGATWTERAASSDYAASLVGAGIGGGAFPNPNRATATFTLAQPALNLNGIRLIGLNGGTAGGGFLGVFDLGVFIEGPISTGSKLIDSGLADGQFRFKFDSKAGVAHIVEFKKDLPGATWQTHTTIPGDGTQKQVTSPLTDSRRFFRISNQ